MSIFTRIKKYYDDKRLLRLESDLMTLSNKNICFNPRHIVNVALIDTQKEFTLKMQENLVWFTGKSRSLREFYSVNVDLTQDLNFFWRTAPADYRKIHSGVPKNISNKMAVILFGGGFDIEVEIFKTNPDGTISEEIDEDKSKQVKEIIEILRDVCDIEQIFKKSAATESWCGHLFLKLSYDTDLTEYPIVEITDIRNAEVLKKRGITTAIIFKNWINHNKNNYVHKEIYTTNDKGFAVIQNKLYKIGPTGDEEEIPLVSIPDTKDLELEYVFEGLKGMLAFEKPNKLPNSEFLDSYYGASDYAGASPAYDALDEVLSEIYAEIRNNKTIRYIPEDMLEFTEDGKLAQLNTFVTNFIKTSGSLDQGAKKEINITQIADKQDSLGEKWKVGMTTACNQAGISPLALGVTGLEAVNSGEQSQRERNKATLETRADKLGIWKPFSEEVFIQLLQLVSWMQQKKLVKHEGLPKIDVDFSNCNVNVNFGDYIVESQDKQIDTWGSAKSLKVASTYEAVKNIHPDWNDTKVDEEVNRIRYEEGMGLDDPNNLPNLTGKEKEDEENEEEDMTDKIENNNNNPKDKDVNGDGDNK